MPSLRLALLLVAGCGGAVGSDPTVTGSASPSQVTPGQTITVNVDVDNFVLVDPVENTEDEDGAGHYHVYFDEVSMDTLLAIDHLPSTEVVIPDDVAPGTIHKLIVTLRDNDHDERVPNVRDDVTVEVLP